MNWLLPALAFLLAFITMAYFLPKWIRAVKRKKFLLRVDENKFSKPLVPTIGGVALASCFIFSLILVELISLLLKLNSVDVALLQPALLTTALVALFGLVDDIIVIPRRFTKPILAFLASVPMMAASGLCPVIHIPFFGGVDFGILYFILIVPLFIVFCANAVNILSTYNGLETGLALVVSTGLFAAAWIKGEFTGALFMAPLIAVLLVFFPYNKFPARVFLGNVGTLFIGAALAVGALVGNVERVLVILMVPYFIHFLMYSRNRFRWKPKMWGKPQKDGTLKCQYPKPFGLMHLIMMKFRGATEKKIVTWLICAEVVFAAIAVLLEIGMFFI